MKPTIREVIKNQAGTGKDCKPRIPIAQAVAQIKEMFKSVVGENKDELKNLDINNPIRKFNGGYNLRGDEANKRIEEL